MIGTALLLPALVSSLALPAPTPEPRFDLGLREAYETVSASGIPDQGYRLPDLTTASAVEPMAFDEPGFGRRIALDALALGHVPFEMNARKWRRFSLGLALVGVASLFDDELNEGSDRFRDDVGVRAGRAIRPLGQEAGIALLGITWLAGRGMHRPEMVAIAQDGLEATVLTALVVAPLKEIVGRTRPRDTQSAQGFSPFSGGQSFPSGEASQAFALASVLAAHSEHRWVKVTAYGLAALVGLSRIELDGHWASDVVAGALIGHAIGGWVAKRHAGHGDRESGVHWRLAPTYDRDQRAWGVGGAISF